MIYCRIKLSNHKYKSYDNSLILDKPNFKEIKKIQSALNEFTLK